MRLSIFSDEIAQDYEHAVRVAERHGVFTLELRSAWDKGVYEFTRSDMIRIRDCGADIAAIASPFLKCDLFDSAAVSAHLDGLLRCIDMAQTLNTRIIRGFTGWRVERDARCLDRLRAVFTRALDVLNGTDIILALESDPSVNACNAAELVEVIGHIANPQVKATWDPGNDLFAPVFESPFPNGYDIIRPYIAHVHLKDAVVEDDVAQAVCLGEGEVHIFELLRALSASKYDGYLSIEPHYRINGQLPESLLKLPGGADFSDGAEAAAVESMIAAREMLSSL